MARGEGDGFLDAREGVASCLFYSYRYLADRPAQSARRERQSRKLCVQASGVNAVCPTRLWPVNL